MIQYLENYYNQNLKRKNNTPPDTSFHKNKTRINKDFRPQNEI